MNISLAFYVLLAYFSAMGVAIAVLYVVADKLDKKYGFKLKQRAQGLEVDAKMIESLSQTRVFLRELTEDSSLPEEVRHRAAVLHRHYPGRKHNEA